MCADEIVSAAGTDAERRVVLHRIKPRVADARDVDVSASLAGLVAAEGEAKVERSMVGMMAVEGDVEATRSGAGALMGRNVTAERMFTGATVARDISASNSRIGLALAGKMSVSDDSRVLIGPAAVLILIAATLGFFGLLAIAGVFVVRRARSWRPKVPTISWRRMGE